MIDSYDLNWRLSAANTHRKKLFCENFIKYIFTGDAGRVEDRN